MIKNNGTPKNNARAKSSLTLLATLALTSTEYGHKELLVQSILRATLVNQSKDQSDHVFEEKMVGL